MTAFNTDDISSGGVKSKQDGFVNSISLSAGTGEDAKYVDITITAVTMSKSLVYFDGGASNTLADCMIKASTSSSESWQVTARLTSATNLRISCANGGAAVSRIAGRYTILEQY